jgi:hypothetical protein
MRHSPQYSFLTDGKRIQQRGWGFKSLAGEGVTQRFAQQASIGRAARFRAAIAIGGQVTVATAVAF